MYGETNQEKRQVAVMEAAFQQGYVTKANDLKNLAQLYYLNGAPFKAAQLMEKSLAEKKLDENLKNLEFLAQAWSNAKEYEKAIPVLEQAAKLSGKGDNYSRLAQVYLNMEQWDKVITYGKKAMDKGVVKNMGHLQVSLGMAYFNLKKFNSSIRYFEMAAKDKKVKKVALQWIKYVSKEKEKQQKLVAALDTKIR